METAGSSADAGENNNNVKRFTAETKATEQDSQKQNSIAVKKYTIEPDASDQNVPKQDVAKQEAEKSVAEDTTDADATEQDVPVQDVADKSIFEQVITNKNAIEQNVADQTVNEQDATYHDVTPELNSSEQNVIDPDTQESNVGIMKHEVSDLNAAEKIVTVEDTPEQDSTTEEVTTKDLAEQDAAAQDRDDSMQDISEQDAITHDEDALIQDIISEQDAMTQDEDALIQDVISEQDAITQDKDALIQDIISEQDAITQDKDAFMPDISEQDGMELVIINQGVTQDTADKITTEQKSIKQDVSWQDTFKEETATEQDAVNDREKRSNKIRKFLKFLEVTILALVMLLLIGLFLIPTFFYVFSSLSTDQLTETTLNSSYNPSMCDNAVPYSGEVCADVFVSLQECYSDTESSLHIPSTTDQNQAESTAQYLNNALSSLPQFIRPTEECTKSIKPFLCLHLFGFCDGNGDFHTTLRSECFRIREDVCSQEWMLAAEFVPPNTLPVCENLPSQTDKCKDNSTSTAAEESSLTLLDSLNCSEGFFHDINNTGLCRPQCGAFGHKGFAFDITERIAMGISLLASVVMFILALTYQRSTLLTFPSILLVYLCGSTFLIAVVIIIGSLDNKGLFCSTEDQILAAGQGNETVYCTLSGVVFQYTLAQTCVWALLHAVFLFWSLIFPFNYRRLRTSGRARYAHVISVLVALLAPLPGALAPLKDGFISTRNPSLVCQARNADYIYFFLVLPSSVVLALSSCLMVITFWIIFKEFVLKKLIAGKKVGKIGKAEVKMAVISSYYIVVGVLSLFVFTYFEVKAKANRDSLLNLFLCESSGNSDCQIRAKTASINVLNILSEIVLILVGFFPVVAVMFSYDTRTYKKVRGSLKITTQSSRRSSSLHKNLPVYRSKKN